LCQATVALATDGLQKKVEVKDRSAEEQRVLAMEAETVIEDSFIEEEAEEATGSGKENKAQVEAEEETKLDTERVEAEEVAGSGKENKAQVEAVEEKKLADKASSSSSTGSGQENKA
jgi:hypothetical protein